MIETTTPNGETAPPGEITGHPILLPYSATASTEEKLYRLHANVARLFSRHQSQGLFAQEVYFEAVEALKAINETLRQISQKLSPDRAVPPPPPEIT